MNAKALYEIYLQSKQVFTDSRKISPGGLFFALKGERFDGNKYAGQALEQGAAYAIVDNPAVVKGKRYILVRDVLASLQELARYHRRQFIIPVIAITGSNGKTTTKELVHAVLSAQYRAHCTQGNLNNHIGVPLTLLAMPPQTDTLIVEMGANHQREIDFLCRIAEPTHGLITNIGRAHLEGFGGLEGVKKGKGELYRYLAETNGTAFVDKDEPFLEGLAEAVRKKVFYIESEQPSPNRPDLEVRRLAIKPFVKVAFLEENKEILEVQSQLIGDYNFNNIKAAVALGKYFKVPGLKIKTAVENYVPANNRSQILKRNGNTFILDAYNANPSSMQEAVRNLGTMTGAPKIAILGDMLELGEYTAEAHEAIARQALEQHFDRLILVGPLFKAIALQLSLLHFPDTLSAKRWFGEQRFENALILVKGSRGIGLERLLDREN